MPFLSLYFFAVAVLILLGCTPPGRPPTPGERSAATARGNGDVAMVSADSQDAADEDKLARLWQSRTQEGPLPDYPLGPGDVLEIAAPPMVELQNYTVRISGEGTISLPLIGIVRAGGMNEATLSEEIRRRLEATYVRDPQVHIFVREYRSRQVAVVGAVEKPGLYSLASGADTIWDMIAQAGGMTEQAALRIHFIPAEPVDKEQAKQLASTLPVALGSPDPSSLIIRRTDPIVLDLSNATRGGSQLALALPVRPGDLILVPGNGEVLVEGWVKKPGSYKITARMTVIGAVAAAEGPIFAADTSVVSLIRTGKDGERIFLSTDLEKIKHGESPDVPVQDGDVIEVPYATT